jgi:hypothetical protein
VEGTFDVLDDPVLIGTGGRPVDAWKEEHPYDERMERDEYEARSPQRPSDENRFMLRSATPAPSRPLENVRRQTDNWRAPYLHIRSVAATPRPTHNRRPERSDPRGYRLPVGGPHGLPSASLVVPEAADRRLRHQSSIPMPSDGDGGIGR